MHGDFRAAPAGSAQTSGNSAAAGRNNGVSLPEEGIAWAASCVRGTCEASALANSMLTGVVVTETLDSAFRIKAANSLPRVATLAGEFISREGVVRGGQIGENGGQSALSRRAQISRLEGQLAAVAARVESFTSARSEALQAQERGHDALLAATEGFQRAQVENAAIQNEQKLAERQLAELESRRVAYLREIAQLEESLRAGLGDLENSQSTIAEMTRSLEHYRLQRAEAENAAETMRQRETTAIEDLNEIRVRVATGRQQLENLNRQRGPMAARLTELTEILDARRTDVAAHESRVQSLVAESDDLRRSARFGEKKSPRFKQTSPNAFRRDRRRMKNRGRRSGPQGGTPGAYPVAGHKKEASRSGSPSSRFGRKTCEITLPGVTRPTSRILNRIATRSSVPSGIETRKRFPRTMLRRKAPGRKIPRSLSPRKRARPCPRRLKKMRGTSTGDASRNW